MIEFRLELVLVANINLGLRPLHVRQLQNPRLSERTRLLSELCLNSPRRLLLFSSPRSMFTSFLASYREDECAVVTPAQSHNARKSPKNQDLTLLVWVLRIHHANHRKIALAEKPHSQRAALRSLQLDVLYITRGVFQTPVFTSSSTSQSARKNASSWSVSQNCAGHIPGPLAQSSGPQAASRHPSRSQSHDVKPG